MQTENTKLYYSISEALAASSVGRTRLYQAIREGAISGVRKLGTRTIVSVAGLRAWLDNLPEIGRTPQ